MVDYAGKWQDDVRWGPTPPRPLVVEAGAEIVLLGAIITVILAVDLVQLSWRGVVGAGLCYAVIVTLVAIGLRRHAPHRHFGLANAITLCRAGLNALFLAVAAEILLGGPLVMDAELRWGLTIAATITLFMDGLDGWAARQSKMTSEFGARFDMEMDALFIMALALILTSAAIVGPWVLVSGLAYYAFRLAGGVWPILTAPLPPSWRRKAICVAQGALLIVALAPSLPLWSSWASCFIGLVLLVGSFSVDLIWLTGWRR